VTIVLIAITTFKTAFIIIIIDDDDDDDACQSKTDHLPCTLFVPVTLTLTRWP